MKRIPIVVSLLGACLLASALSACGNKGPLVRPTDPPPEEAAEAEAQTPAEIDAGAEADPLPADQLDAPATTLPTDATVPVDPEQDGSSDGDPPGDG